MTTYRLEPDAPRADEAQPSGGDGLSSDILCHDARWFTRIRWAVVGAFVLFGVASTWFPGLLAAMHIEPPSVWPWVLAGIVALVNLATIAWLRRIPSGKTGRALIRTNIWFQITADLMVLTALVYLVGTLETVMPFAYLFHIVLACIFFEPRKSLRVLLLSAGLFLTAVCLEATGILPPRGILALAARRTPSRLAFGLTVAPTLLVWGIVWFLTSHISSAVRQRDRELELANQRLRKADRDKNLQVLRVAHDLKAPFAGIESNIEVLRLSCWDKVPDEVRRIIARIETRGATLRARIGDILTLGELRSDRDAPLAKEYVSLRDLVAGVIGDVRDLATRRRIEVLVKDEEGGVYSDPKPLKILLQNLLSNALTYSHEGQTVEIAIACKVPPATIRVADQGIGIDEKALPHIFDDYYRSRDAAAFNAQATGLGLAIVRQIARNLGLTLTVESDKGRGTTFEVLFPHHEGRNEHGNDSNH